MYPRFTSRLGNHYLLVVAVVSGMVLTSLNGAALAGDEALPEPEVTADNPFWDKASAGYMFRASYFERTSDGDVPA